MSTTGKSTNVRVARWCGSTKEVEKNYEWEYGKGFTNEVALEMDIEIWRGAKKAFHASGTARGVMWKEWSIIAGLRYFQEEKKREAVGTVGAIPPKPELLQFSITPLATCSCWAHEIWLFWIELCCNAHRLQKLGLEKNVKYLLINFVLITSTTMKIFFGYIGFKLNIVNIYCTVFFLMCLLANSKLHL